VTLNIWTGFHWCSPVNPNNSAMAEELLQKTSRWGTVILASGQSSGSADPNFTDACDKALSAIQAGGGVDLSECIARIYFGNNPCHPNYSDINSVSTAQTWLTDWGYFNSLNYFIGKGGRMCVVFNELNQGGSTQSCSDPGGEPQYGIDPRVMGCLGYELQSAYYNGGNRQLYTLFPGPSGLLSQSAFSNYFQYSSSSPNFNYDLWNTSNSQAQTFGQVYGSNVDSLIANRTMLYHGGSGVYDRVALHCYASTPTQFAISTVASNPALQYIQWLLNVDATGWVYVTESSGSNSYDDYNEGVALAKYEYNVSGLNSESIGSGGFGGQVQAVYGYILDISNAGASRNMIDRFSCHATDGYNYERGVLGF
jgi:hypothetical protein